jgi:hypothetical protein
MSFKQILLTTAKVVALSLYLFVIWSALSGLISAQMGIVPHDMTENAGSVMAALFTVALCNTLVLSYTIMRSAWSGWALSLAILWIFFGISTFNSQIETLYFNAGLSIPLIEVLSFIVIGFAVAALYSPVAVWLLGLWRPRPGVEKPPAPIMGRMEWLIKLVVIAGIVYPVLYFLFGYFIAWQQPALRELYTGSDSILPFMAHLGETLRSDPWLYPWQVLRGLIWVALAWPVIRMSRGSWWETSIMVGLLFAVLMNAQHLIPNPYMPFTVRMAHLVETATSNFIFGFIIVWLLHRHHSSFGDLWHEPARLNVSYR